MEPVGTEYVEQVSLGDRAPTVCSALARCGSEKEAAIVALQQACLPHKEQEGKQDQRVGSSRRAHPPVQP